MLCWVHVYIADKAINAAGETSSSLSQLSSITSTLTISEYTISISQIKAFGRMRCMIQTIL